MCWRGMPWRRFTDPGRSVPFYLQSAVLRRGQTSARARRPGLVPASHQLRRRRAVQVTPQAAGPFRRRPQQRGHPLSGRVAGGCCTCIRSCLPSSSRPRGGHASSSAEHPEDARTRGPCSWLRGPLRGYDLRTLEGGTW
jgi:hypothetical protein